LKEHTSAELEASNQTENPDLFGYELLRGDLLPALLGKDTPEILYWAGKHLARKHPLKSLLEINDFFIRASWGSLELKVEDKNEMEFELASPLMVSRVKSKSEHFFQLEAGFLAQQIEFLKDAVTEAFEHPLKKDSKVKFTVKWDHKDTL
jgi:predicted hydrocarbon binding protein